MKSLIKNLLRENLLREKLTDVGDDVEMLYMRFFDHDIKELEQTDKIINDMFVYSESDTSILTSKECLEAHKLNPCTFRVNTGYNAYDPNKKIIHIGINDNAVTHVKNEGGNLTMAMDGLLHPNQKASLAHEFSPEKIKGSIHHELAHWIDDTFHNGHIKHYLDKAIKLKTKTFNGVPVNTTKMEIQGQIHNIKQLHNKYKDIWDTLSFYDMIRYSPALLGIFNGLNGELKAKWIRDIKTRMHREGLLGKNMID
jgi:hypothetical protein